MELLICSIIYLVIVAFGTWYLPLEERKRFKERDAMNNQRILESIASFIETKKNPTN